MNNTISCLGCPDRFIGCHAECPKYKKFREELETRKAIIKKERKKDDEYQAYRVNNIYRYNAKIGGKSKY